MDGPGARRLAVTPGRRHAGPAVETAGAGRAEMAQVLATEAALALRHPVAITALQDAVYAWTRLLEIPRAQPESPITPI